MNRTFVIYICYFFYFSNLLCTTVYNEITNEVDNFFRPLTFLAITKNTSFIVNLANQYPHHVFILLSTNIDSFENTYPTNMIHLDYDCSCQKLNHLRESEHFDIAFIDYHYNSLTTEYASVLSRLAEHIFISLKSNLKEFSYTLSNNNFLLITDNQKELLFYKKQHIPFLRRTQWLEPGSDKNRVRNIISTYKIKMLYKNFGTHPVSSVWLPGINLITFKILNGKVPTTKALIKEVERTYEIPHPDWMPNNIIVQGNQLALIDFKDPFPGEQIKVKKSKRLLQLMQLFVTNAPANISAAFKKMLIYCRKNKKINVIATYN